MKNFMLSVMTRFMGADKWYDDVNKIGEDQMPTWVKNIIVPILKVLDQLLVPVIIILGVAGAIYGIVLGVQFSKAETADKRDETKKRLINAVIGVVIMLVALIGMKIFVANAGTIFGWVDSSSQQQA